MSVTAPAGLPGRGRRGRTQDQRRQDLALIVNDGPSDDSAARLHRQPLQGQPGALERAGRHGRHARAVVLNSGGANCYTGPAGFQTTHATAEQVAEPLGIGAIDVVVCSTGLIGLVNDRASGCSPAPTRRTPRSPATAARRRRRRS